MPASILLTKLPPIFAPKTTFSSRRQIRRSFQTILSSPTAGALQEYRQEFDVVSCKDCRGTGKLAAGGYHQKNPVKFSKLVGTKWTAREAVLGWRHFVATERRRCSIADYVLLVATCDAKAQIWVRALQASHSCKPFRRVWSSKDTNFDVNTYKESDERTQRLSKFLPYNTTSEDRKNRWLAVAACIEQDTTTALQINIHNLKDRSSWACGWLQKAQLAALDEQLGAVCKTCQGSGLAEGYTRF